MGDVHKAAMGYPKLPDLPLLKNVAAVLIAILKSFCLSVAQKLNKISLTLPC